MDIKRSNRPSTDFLNLTAAVINGKSDVNGLNKSTPGHATMHFSSVEINSADSQQMEKKLCMQIR